MKAVQELKIRLEELYKNLAEISEVDNRFLCPINKTIMVYPVMVNGYDDSDYNCYEKSAILKWGEGNETSPLTREKLNIHAGNLLLDRELQREIAENFPIVEEIHQLEEKKSRLEKEYRISSLQRYGFVGQNGLLSRNENINNGDYNACAF